MSITYHMCVYAYIYICIYTHVICNFIYIYLMHTCRHVCVYIYTESMCVHRMGTGVPRLCLQSCMGMEGGVATSVRRLIWEERPQSLGTYCGWLRKDG